MGTSRFTDGIAAGFLGYPYCSHTSGAALGSGICEAFHFAAALATAFLIASLG